MALLVTITCYGSHLPGDARGSHDHVRQGVHREIVPSPTLEAHQRVLMRATPFLLTNGLHRQVVLNAVQAVCLFRAWPLLALHIRHSHWHGVVDAPGPGAVLRDWKSYSTRGLRQLPGEPPGRVYWTRGGNVRVLRSPEAIRAAVHYVLTQQGEPSEHIF